MAVDGGTHSNGTHRKGPTFECPECGKLVSAAYTPQHLKTQHEYKALKIRRFLNSHTPSTDDHAPAKKKRFMGPEARARISKAMKARWAQRQQAKATKGS